MVSDNFEKNSFKPFETFRDGCLFSITQMGKEIKLYEKRYLKKWRFVYDFGSVGPNNWWSDLVLFHDCFCR